MNEITRLCETSQDYPANLAAHNTHQHVLVSYFEHLNQRQSQLFRNEDEGAALDFIDLAENAKGFWPRCVQNMTELREKLSLEEGLRGEDPRCRFIFVHAPSSRDRLNVTRQMLMLLFSYHNVMPNFLDYLFSFGKQLHAQDFHFGGFRQQNCLQTTDTVLKAPELGRSGRDLRLCYSLKSVEPSEGQQDWPWSIRQTAVYHSFDVEAGRATWIMIKGDEMMKNRIKAATSLHGPQTASAFATTEQAFKASLGTHLILCDWANENWRWYIGFLEEKFQGISRHTLSRNVEKSNMPLAGVSSSSAAKFGRSQLDGRVPSLERRLTELSQHTTPKSPTPQALPQPLPPGVQEYPTSYRDPAELDRGRGPSDFSFTDLQKIQNIEEKATETLLILKVNSSVLRDLREYYQSLAVSKDVPQKLRQNSEEDCAKFGTRIRDVERELQIHQMRVETLLSLLGHRKSLLYGILEHQNTEANRLLATEAQMSAKDMEALTYGTLKLAEKTKQETVSMRIITLVTLAFLPGTFISVGLLTLMSTDIIKFPSTGPEPAQRVVQPKAIHFYLMVSLPLVFGTFLAWYGFYLWETRKEKQTGKPSREGYRDASEKV